MIETGSNTERKTWGPLIAECKSNGRKAQEDLYRHFFPIMERMVLRYTRDEDQVIDILNDGFLKVFQNLASYHFKGSFEGWIRKIMFRSLSDYFRKSKKDLAFLIYESEFTVEPKQGPNHKLYYKDLISLLDKLPEIQMKVFHLFAVEGYSHKEISDELQLNQNTCRWHLAEARKILQKEYHKNYSNSFNETG